MVLSFSGMVEDVFAQNNLPVADAGPDQIVASGATVTLDGSGSSDSDGTVEHYFWQVPYTPAYTITLTTTVNPTFTAPTGPATIIISLAVVDNDGRRSTA
ncbi:MAG: PKD domain-containing protein, partial [Thaumarchaeota archaeon]|nr:PKD domain-containing protein [Nitrososphaerota archaeon]